MSESDVEIVELDPTPAVVFRKVARKDRLGAVIDNSIRRLRTSVSAAGVATAGPPFVRFLDAGDTELEIEVGLPLTAPQGIPGLRSTILPGGAAAAIWQLGAHEGLPAVFRRLEAWVEENATSAGSPWESYLTEHHADQPRSRVIWPVELP